MSSKNSSDEFRPSEPSRRDSIVVNKFLDATGNPFSNRPDGLLQVLSVADSVANEGAVNAKENVLHSDQAFAYFLRTAKASFKGDGVSWKAFEADLDYAFSSAFRNVPQINSIIGANALVAEVMEILKKKNLTDQNFPVQSSLVALQKYIEDTCEFADIDYKGDTPLQRPISGREVAAVIKLQTKKDIPIPDREFATLGDVRKFVINSITPVVPPDDTVLWGNIAKSFLIMQWRRQFVVREGAVLKSFTVAEAWRLRGRDDSKIMFPFVIDESIASPIRIFIQRQLDRYNNSINAYNRLNSWEEVKRAVEDHREFKPDDFPSDFSPEWKRYTSENLEQFMWMHEDGLLNMGPEYELPGDRSVLPEQKERQKGTVFIPSQLVEYMFKKYLTLMHGLNRAYDSNSVEMKSFKAELDAVAANKDPITSELDSHGYISKIGILMSVNERRLTGESRISNDISRNALKFVAENYDLQEKFSFTTQTPLHPALDSATLVEVIKAKVEGPVEVTVLTNRRYNTIGEAVAGIKSDIRVVPKGAQNVSEPIGLELSDIGFRILIKQWLDNFGKQKVMKSADFQRKLTALMQGPGGAPGFLACPLKSNDKQFQDAESVCLERIQNLSNTYASDFHTWDEFEEMILLLLHTRLEWAKALPGEYATFAYYHVLEALNEERQLLEWARENYLLDGEPSIDPQTVGLGLVKPKAILKAQVEAILEFFLREEGKASPTRQLAKLSSSLEVGALKAWVEVITSAEGLTSLLETYKKGMENRTSAPSASAKFRVIDDDRAGRRKAQGDEVLRKAVPKVIAYILKNTDLAAAEGEAVSNKESSERIEKIELPKLPSISSKLGLHLISKNAGFVFLAPKALSESMGELNSLANSVTTRLFATGEISSWEEWDSFCEWYFTEREIIIRTAPQEYQQWLFDYIQYNTIQTFVKTQNDIAAVANFSGSPRYFTEERTGPVFSSKPKGIFADQVLDAIVDDYEDIFAEDEVALLRKATWPATLDRFLLVTTHPAFVNTVLRIQAALLNVFPVSKRGQDARADLKVIVKNYLGYAAKKFDFPPVKDGDGTPEAATSSRFTADIPTALVAADAWPNGRAIPTAKMPGLNKIRENASPHLVADAVFQGVDVDKVMVTFRDAASPFLKLAREMEAVNNKEGLISLLGYIGAACDAGVEAVKGSLTEEQLKIITDVFTSPFVLWRNSALLDLGLLKKEAEVDEDGDEDDDAGEESDGQGDSEGGAAGDGENSEHDSGFPILVDETEDALLILGVETPRESMRAIALGVLKALEWAGYPQGEDSILVIVNAFLQREDLVTGILTRERVSEIIQTILQTNPEAFDPSVLPLVAEIAVAGPRDPLQFFDVHLQVETPPLLGDEVIPEPQIDEVISESEATATDTFETLLEAATELAEQVEGQINDGVVDTPTSLEPTFGHPAHGLHEHGAPHGHDEDERRGDDEEVETRVTATSASATGVEVLEIETRRVTRTFDGEIRKLLDRGHTPDQMVVEVRRLMRHIVRQAESLQEDLVTATNDPVTAALVNKDLVNQALASTVISLHAILANLRGR